MASKSEIEKRAKKLESIVAELIEAEPFERDGVKWACRPIDFYCEQLGVSDKTVRNMFKEPPFQKRQGHTGTFVPGEKGYGRMEGGEPVCLVRIGEHVMTPNDAKNIMAKIFKDKFPEYVESSGPRWEKDRQRLYNVAKDMAEDTSAQFAVKVFEWTLDNWQTAAGAMKFAAEATPNYKPRFWGHPNIGYICHFWQACAYAYLVEMQMKGKLGDDMEVANKVSALCELYDPFKGHPGDASTLAELKALGEKEPLLLKYGKPSGKKAK